MAGGLTETPETEGGRARPMVVGLTGGIGSGKSTVSRLFEQRGVPVLDADDVARELVRPGSPILTRIVEAFGPAVLTPDGELDRAAMRQRVFREPAERERLEAILHPAIRREIRSRMARLTTPYCILSVPLLLEKGTRYRIDRVLVVDAADETRIRRVQARSCLSREEVLAIMRAQAGREARLARADDVLDNDDGLEHLEQQVAALHARYQTLARTHATGGHP